MNYKTLDVADVIGAMFFLNAKMESLPSSSIINVLSSVHERDKFINIDMSRSAYLRVMDLADGNAEWHDGMILFKDNEVCMHRFLGCYYSVDDQTRNLLYAIVEELS